jgi:hypothetical protein
MEVDTPLKVCSKGLWRSSNGQRELVLIAVTIAESPIKNQKYLEFAFVKRVYKAEDIHEVAGGQSNRSIGNFFLPFL